MRGDRAEYGTDPECGGTHRSYYDRLYGSTAVVVPIEEAQRVYRETGGRGWINCGSCGQNHFICWPSDSFNSNGGRPPPQDDIPGDDFLVGIADGTRICADAAERLVGAVAAILAGDFVGAQHLLGIDRADIASQIVRAIWEDLNTPVIGVHETPYQQGVRIGRRLCTYAIPPPPGQARGGGPTARGGGLWRGIVRESKGANVWSGRYHVDPHSGARYPIMGRSRTPRSHATSTLANKGESLAYHEALKNGEIGLQRPAGANVAGVDFISVKVNPVTGAVESVVITDVKTRVSGSFPKPKTTIPGSWRAEVADAVAPGRLDLGDPVLESSIRDAVAQGRVSLRQVEVDFSPSGGGTVSGL